jgi:hypothetical protein
MTFDYTVMIQRVVSLIDNRRGWAQRWRDRANWCESKSSGARAFH